MANGESANDRCRPTAAILRSSLDASFHFRYIAIEGPAGVGKTILADRLGARLDATVVLDETENPFLADFYAERPGAGVPGAAVLPLSRHRQQTALRQADLFSQPRSATTCSSATRSTPTSTSTTTSCSSTSGSTSCWRSDVRAPDLVIYLQAPTDVLRRRLRERGTRQTPTSRRPGEDYIRELNEAYNHFFFHYTATPLLVVETSQFDLTWATRRSPISNARFAPWARARATTSRTNAECKLSAMAWFKKTRKPIEPPPEKPVASPRGCGSSARRAAQIIYNKDLAANLSVCPKCAHHFRLSADRAAAHAVRRGVGRSTTRSWPRPTRCSSPTPSPTSERLESSIASHRPEGRGHRRPPASIDGIETRGRGHGVRLHRRQHGRGGRREDHARDRDGDRAAAAGRHRLAARAAPA